MKYNGRDTGILPPPDEAKVFMVTDWIELYGRRVAQIGSVAIQINIAALVAQFLSNLFRERLPP
jgi:hypothetical protein